MPGRDYFFLPEVAARTRCTTVSPALRAMSSGSVAAEAMRLPGGSSGERGCGFVGAVFFASASRWPSPSSSDLVKLLAQLREQLAFLFLDVVADALGQHGVLGVEALVVGRQPVELGQHPLGHVVLLERLEDEVVLVGHPLADASGRAVAPRRRRAWTAPSIIFLAMSCFVFFARGPSDSNRLNSFSTSAWSALSRAIASM